MKRLLCAVTLLLLASTSDAAIARGEPLPVRILYDNSGSMYPGYRPPGSAERRSRADLGARYFHQSPQFAQWLNAFVQQQTVVDAGTVGMWTFTSGTQFTSNDILQVHEVVPVSDFDAARAIGNFPSRTGSNTYLTETLTTFTRDFTGLVWMITDNIVETTAGEPDAGVRRFFETLARRSEFRSVHLYKYEFEENGQTAALAVYGILVSPADVSDETLAQFDERFRRLRDAANLFPSREHLKLKDLEVAPMQLNADLQLLLEDREKGTFEEGQSVVLEVDGEIRSYLTQHSVTAGRYELAISSPFTPEEWAQRDLGAQPLAPQLFEPVTGQIQEEIPPNGTRQLEAQLRSTQPVSFTPNGVVEWLRLAWSGALVRYSSTVRMSLSDVNVRLERQRMSGIFGIDHASSIFEFQDVTALPEVQPSDVPVTFALQTASSRSGIFVAAIVLIAAILGLLAFLLSRRMSFDISIGATTTTVGLRRLGSHRVMHDTKFIGRLWRGAVSGYGFEPAQSDAMVTVVPAEEWWQVKVKDGTTHRLSIKAKGGGVLKPNKAKTAARTAGPPPPPPPPSRSLAPRAPRIGRT